MSQVHPLRYLMLRMRLVAIHNDERGDSGLEPVLWTAGFFLMLLITWAIVTISLHR